jgi:molybdopterin/thiamine biosynthesis adenylyltransferase/rhodanese-related sulfurtransferase
VVADPLAAPPPADITPAALADLLPAGPLLIDVRNVDECAAGMLAGAIRVTATTLLPQALSAGSRPVVVYCATGRRSAAAVERLATASIPARSLRGGLAAWQAAGLPVTRPDWAAGLAPGALERYSRQLRLPEVGLAGQQRLQAARVLCVGAGGLGSPALLYLAAAGVGCLGIVDGDHVEHSNLQRQVLHTTARIGQAKVASAVRTLSALNPGIDLQTFPVRLGADNARELMGDFDVVIDASDNFATRYLVNDTALALGKPAIYAAIQGFEGQLTTVAGTGSPCYRCLFPQAPPPELAPSCDEAGVLGVVPGVLGVLQATEALKLLLGAGAPLTGRLLLFDALALRFDELDVVPRPDCRCARPAA